MSPPRQSLSRRSLLGLAGSCAAGLIAEAAMPASAVACQSPGGSSQPRELIYLSATRLADMIRRKEVSSEEVVKAYVARIKAVNPRVNAVVQLEEEEAMERARKADQALASGEVWGPLHGVPVTIKDEWETEGIVTTAGTLGRKGYIPNKDATAVSRLKGAGAVVLGKTNLPELGSAIETDNAVYGRTNNPYDLDRTPGGSSGGEAAIIASGGSPLGLGSDGAGSIRIPAHCCGLAGIKPTWGRIPLTGLVLHGPGTGGLWAAAGTLARYVEDLALSLKVLSGPDSEDQYSFPGPLRDHVGVDLSKLRVAFYVTDAFRPSHPEIQSVVKTAVSVLRRANANVKKETPPGVGTEVFWPMMMRLLGADWKLATERGLAELGTRRISPTFEQATRFFERMIAEYQPDVPLNRLEAHRQWFEYQSKMRRFLTEEFDAIVCPAWPTVAPPHGATWRQEGGRNTMEDVVYTAYYNAAQVPAAVVRGGTSSEGLPIGVQVVGGPWREDIVLAIAGLLERELGGWQAPKM